MATYWENSCSFGLRYVSWYKYLIVSLVFSHLGFWSGNLFLIAPFPDLCLLVPSFMPRTILPCLMKILMHRYLHIFSLFGRSIISRGDGGLNFVKTKDRNFEVFSACSHLLSLMFVI